MEYLICDPWEGVTPHRVRTTAFVIDHDGMKEEMGPQDIEGTVETSHVHRTESLLTFISEETDCALHLTTGDDFDI